jgi:hypothetical protein
MWGGFYILHPSEHLAKHDKYYIQYGLGQLGIRAYKNASDKFVYPFVIDSNFDTNDMQVDILLETFGVFKDPSLSTTITLDNTNHYYQFELPPFNILQLTIENTLDIPITKSTIKPVFIYTAG